ncbi:MAG: PucR family transcriptional regulator [Clostridia bacterium]|nr:PucR family transcriptional regulator [Clostridia bacterium]
MGDMLKSDRVPDMSKLSVADAKLIALSELVKSLDKSEREKLLSGYDLKRFAKIFEDASMMLTIDTFLDSGMNVSETARKLYMHRNTLMYRLASVRRKTGLDIRNFDMAVTFKLLHSLYMIK